MKRKILAVGLAITMSVNLTGCAGTSSTDQQAKQSPTVVTEDQQQPTDPKAVEPTEVQTPTTTTPGEAGVKATEEPKTSGGATIDTPVPPGGTDKNKTPAAVEPKTPTKPALPQGTVSLKVGATLPEFVLPDLKGKSTSASAIITSHQLTFINFWATT